MIFLAPKTEASPGTMPYSHPITRSIGLFSESPQGGCLTILIHLILASFYVYHKILADVIRFESIPQALLDKHFLRKHGAGAYYGQPKK